MIGFDANVLVRYLTQDDPGQARIATRLVEKELTAEAPGFVSLIALAETVWVLEDCYRCSKKELLGILQRMLRVKQLVVQEAEIVARASRAFASGNADFADCLIESIGHACGCTQTATFDRSAGKIPGMMLLGKGE